MANKDIPDYVSWLKEPDVNSAFLGLALKNYPLSEVRSALPIGLKKFALQIKGTRPDGAEYFWEKAEALERGEEVNIFGKKIQTGQIRKNNPHLRPPGYKADTHLLERVKDLMEKEYRKDPDSRLNLVLSQLGDIGKYLTHDPTRNPNARPYGSREDEELAFGQAFVQLLGLAHSRGINVKKLMHEYPFMENGESENPGSRLNRILPSLDRIYEYITQDSAPSPGAFHGSPEDELLVYVKAFAVLEGCAQSREIDMEKAIPKGLENWKGQDWKKSKAKKSPANMIIGILGCGGRVTGKAFLDPYCERLDDMDGDILITRFAKPEIASYFRNASGVVTDNGGKTCHAAVIAREYNLPCIVGTGNATERIPHGRKIRMEPGTKPGEGLVHLL